MYQNQPSAKAAERMWLASLPGRRSAPEVAEDGQVLEEVVELAEAARPADDGRLAARVDHEAGREAEGRAAHAAGVDDGLPAVGLDCRHRVLLAHPRAVGARVLEQELIELGAHHLIGVGPPARVLAEPEAPRLALAAPLEGAARLVEEAVALDGGRGADGVEDGERRREERLTDVVTREALALEHQHAAAPVGEQRRRDGARGPAADHQHVGGVSHRLGGI